VRDNRTEWAEEAEGAEGIGYWLFNFLISLFVIRYFIIRYSYERSILLPVSPQKHEEHEGTTRPWFHWFLFTDPGRVSTKVSFYKTSNSLLKAWHRAYAVCPYCLAHSTMPGIS
jgi:hypothetical protein